MEFYFPSNVFTFEDPSPSLAHRCSVDTPAFFANPFFHAIPHEEALLRERARLEAIQRQRAAAERQQEREARAYLEHILDVQHRQALARRRQAQLQYELQRRAEYQRRRQQYELQRQAEYQRRKALAIEQAKQAREQSSQIILVLQDLLFGDQDDEVVSEDNGKGKGKATESFPSPAGNAADPEEVGPIPSTPESSEPVEPTAPVDETSTSGTAQAEGTPESKDILVFTHPFADGASTSVSADSIQVSVDEETKQVTVSGLWESNPRPSSPASSTSSRGRSHSPKRARVSDTDENGNEIVKEDEVEAAGEDFVKVDYTTSNRISKTFSLPEGAKAEHLRAVLTDQGLELWASTN